MNTLKNNAAALLAGLLPAGFLLAGLTGVQAQDGGASLMLVNGHIHTLDADNSIVSNVIIHGGRIVAVGDDLDGPAGDTRVIDLEGRTAVPGLIDSHMHFLRAGLRPGYVARGIESARSIGELQAAVTARAAGIPDGAFITGVGGWNTVQLRERRLPTLAELDEAAPDHPVFLQQFFGASATNSAGKRFLEAEGIVVAEDGMIAPGGMGAAPGNAFDAYDAIERSQTEEDRLRGTRDAMAYANSLGLTTVIDAAGGNVPGSQRFIATRDYEPVMELWRRNEMTVRVRPMFLSIDVEVGDGSGPSEVEERVRNTFMGHGDDMFKVAGLGEQTARDSQGPAFDAVTALAARKRWRVEQHSTRADENHSHIEAFEAANAIAPIAELHWSLTHVHEIDAEIIERLKAIGAGVTVQNQRYYYSPSPDSAGPPFRLIVDSGIAAGGGTDANAGHPMSPWSSIYYMVTGKNIIGDPINAEQAITRLEALKLYTIGSAWFSHDEDDLGTIEVGKLGDIAVLSDDYFEIDEDDLRNLSSVLTIVGGAVVHADAMF